MDTPATQRPAGRVHRVACAVLGWAASVFTRIEVVGGPIPDGPVLVTANHLNALLDPLILFRVAGRPTCPLAKAPLFDQKIVGGILRSLGGLPVYRRQDDPAQMSKNEDTFRGAVAALHQGAAIQIFPEGKSHSEAALEPIRTGAARIALRAEAEKGGTLGLQIVPVGLTYEGKERFRGRVLVEIGEPFGLDPWLGPEGAEDIEAVRGLTAEIESRLREVTLNLDSGDDRALLAAAARIWTREKGVHGWREREGMVEQVPRLRRMAGHLEWLREHDPSRYQRLAKGVREHERIATIVGANEGDVPPTYRATEVVRYLVREVGALLVGMPLAWLGTLIWYPTFIAARWVVPRIGPEPESVATYKLATGMALFPVTLLVMGAAGWWAFGWKGAVLAAAVAPLLGLAAMGWRERWGRVMEDVRLFMAVLRRPQLRRRVAAGRRQLVEEFDRVLEERGMAPGE